MSDEWEPVATIDPRRQFGRPCVNGSRTPLDCLAECVYAGDSVDEVADGYGVFRGDVLLACWWFVYDGHLTASRSKKKRLWVLWADHALGILGGHVKDVDLCDPDDYEPEQEPA